MKTRFVFALLVLLISSVTIATDLRHLTPRPKASFDRTKGFEMAFGAILVVADDADSVTLRAAAYLQERIGTLHSKSLIISKASQYHGGVAILLGVWNSYPALTTELGKRLPPGEKKPSASGYVLDVDSNLIIIAGSDSTGVFNGVASLLQLTTSSSAIATVAGCHIWDYPDYPVRWVFSTHNLLVNSNITLLKALADTMALYKLNGLQQNDFKYAILQTQGANYFRNTDSLKTSLDSRGIDIIPGVIGLGGSSGILYNDPNLAEGLKAVSTYVIEADTGRLIPDSRVTIVNGNFESISNNKFTGWNFYDGSSDPSYIDHSIFHSGATSAKCSHFHSNNPAGNARFNVKVNCDSNGYYVMSVWMKTDNLQGGNVQLLAIGGDDNRTLTFTSLDMPSTKDWTRAEVTFNTLGNRSVLLYCGIWGADTGTIWFDDFSIQPGGLCNVLRRGGTPVIVKNKSTSQTYSEGSDFNAISDPVLNSSNGNYFPWHTPPIVRRKTTGSLHNGDTVSISYYHPFAAISDNSGNGSVMACVSEDTLNKILLDQVQRVNNLYKPSTFFMGHDEIRNMNHDDACLSQKVYPAVLLSNNITTCHGLIRTVNPQSDILIWSDMIDSLHNAHNNYYLINGDLTGDWLNIPKDITVVNWNGGKQKESLQFFTKYGFRQISSPYYDAGNTSTIRSWRLAQEGIAGVRGMMYTTWANDYGFLGPFAYYAWGAGPNIIHTPLDTAVLGMKTLSIDAEVYPDPYDATDAITSVVATIYDTAGSQVSQLPLSSTDNAKYHIGTTTVYPQGFLYSITAVNKQGLKRTSPRYEVINRSIASTKFLLDAPDTVHVNGNAGGHSAFHIPISNIGDSTVKVGVPFIIPFGAPFMMLGQVTPDPIPANGVAEIAISYNPSKEECDTAYLYIPYSGNNQLVIVIIACTEFAGASLESQAKELGITINPNPFNLQTSVAITNTSPKMKVMLTDLLGNTTVLPCQRQMMLDAKALGLREGTYILRVENGTQTLTRNIILLK